MTRKEIHYLAYLLRIWESGDPGAQGWRASLENPHTGERLGFGTLEQLFAFLQDQCAKDDHGYASLGRPSSDQS